MKEFRDKVAVITGAASGIGRGLAQHCAEEGMNIVLADVEEKALALAEKEIKAMGAPTLAVPTDVSKAGDVEALTRKTLNEFGAVHLLCNNAGVSAGTTVWESTLADWQWVMGVNLWGVIHGIHYFVPIMIEQATECYIVNTASAAGLFVTANNCVYTVTKHGVVILSEALYCELKQGGYNIGVSVLCPGYINTNILESERNRPVELQNSRDEGHEITDPGLKAMMQSYKKIIENGMSPEQNADIVFNAIREEKFYIMANAEPFIPLMKARMEDILEERNPTNVAIDIR